MEVIRRFFKGIKMDKNVSIYSWVRSINTFFFIRKFTGFLEVEIFLMKFRTFI